MTIDYVSVAFTSGAATLFAVGSLKSALIKFRKCPHCGKRNHSTVKVGLISYVSCNECHYPNIGVEFSAYIEKLNSLNKTTLKTPSVSSKAVCFNPQPIDKVG